MENFDEHSLDVLEYGKVISLLKGLCLTKFGVNKADDVSPGQDLEAINRRLDEISQMKDIIRFGEAFPLYRLEDCTGIIRKSKTEGIFLDPPEFLALLEFIEVSSELNGYAKDQRENFPLIDKYLSGLHPFPEIKKAIIKTIDRDGTILDSASPKLKEVRRKISDLKRKITNKLQQLLADRTKLKGWQDDTVTQRDGRYVIPVQSGQFRPDSGIIHDRSQSGATLFIEPKETVEMNNQLGLMLQEERLEIDRILRALTAQVAEGADRMLVNCDLIGELDYIHAAADFSIQTESNRPVISKDFNFNLIGARHPLLMYYMKDKDEIIANDISLEKGRSGIIITGPNTGGKTVFLKTVGLLILMAQSGLHIPADDKSRIGIYRNIFADIGDEQSIELSLSTFSSHLRQIVYAVKNSGEGCLLLFDEIGAGTDPKEGAALAEAILLEISRKNVQIIVTTHYSQLKTLPMMHPEYENASFEFDRKSLRPTFRLHMGIPGASYAVEIASQLGMSQSITDEATKLLGSGERSLNKLTQSLEKELGALRKDKASLEERLKKAGQLEDYYKSRLAELESSIDIDKKKQMAEIEKLLNDSRVEIERQVREIRETSADKGTVKKAHGFLKEKTAELKRIKAKEQDGKRQKYVPQAGDLVRLKHLSQEGEVIEPIGDNRFRVQVGNVTMTVETASLEKLEKNDPASSEKRRISPVDREETPGPELHLLGMTVDEALEAMDRYFDKAVMNNMTRVYVIHGKGTGALRKMVADFLRGHHAVESFRLGDWNEGGAGVTIVQLKH